MTTPNDLKDLKETITYLGRRSNGNGKANRLENKAEDGKTAKGITPKTQSGEFGVNYIAFGFPDADYINIK